LISNIQVASAEGLRSRTRWTRTVDYDPNGAPNLVSLRATTALKLDPSLPEAHFSLAQTLQHDWNWPEAEKEYKLALKLNPNYVNAHLEYGRFVQALGRNGEALVHVHYADELDPLNSS
jgi:Tfp pilus assembly protein PilF